MCSQKMPIWSKKSGLAPEFVVSLDILPAFHLGIVELFEDQLELPQKLEFGAEDSTL